MSAIESVGRAERQGLLWGARPDDWAEVEEQQLKTYEEGIRLAEIRAGKSVLDVGCGTGTFLALAARHGAEPAGIDAAERLLARARGRLPDADLRTGDMEDLPFDDDSFDVVTGFNSFFFATDLVAALTEAGRVAKPGGSVLIQVWGAPERNDLTAMLRAIGSLRGGPQPAPLYEDGVLEDLSSRAGLEPREARTVGYFATYPDEATLLRRLLSAGGATEAIEATGEETVRGLVADALRPYGCADGSYRLHNEWHFLLAGVR